MEDYLEYIHASGLHMQITPCWAKRLSLQQLQVFYTCTQPSSHCIYQDPDKFISGINTLAR